MNNSSPLIANLLETSPYLNIYDNTRTISVQQIPNVIYSNIDTAIGIKNGYSDVLNGSNEFLSGDKSLKNSIDVLLHPYIKLFKDKKCVTTSSCSGRIVILAKNLSAGAKKCETLFLKVSHSHVNLHCVLLWIQSVTNGSPFYSKQTYKLSPEVEILLKYEPFVIHVEFPNFDQAVAILEVAKEFGLKQSGLISARKRYILAIRGSQNFEAPIARYSSNGIDWLITEDTLNYYLKVCNRKHTDNLGDMVGFYWKLYYSTHNYYTYYASLNPLIDVRELNGYKYMKRWGSSSCIIGDSVYVFGGFTAGSNPPILSIYSIKRNVWAYVYQNYTIKSIFSCILPIADGNIAVVMGRSSPIDPSDEVHIIDISANYQLTRAEPITTEPAPRFRHSIAPIKGNTFYMYGGITHGYNFLGDLWKGTICKSDGHYTIFWSQLVDCPMALASSTITYYYGTVYVIGGMNAKCWCNFMDKIWAFNPANCAWNFINVGGDKFPNNRASHSSVQIGNSVIVMGGISTNESSYGMMLFDIWRLDLDELKWYYLGDVPHNNTIVKSSIVYDTTRELLYLIGGGIVCFTFGSVFQRPLSLRLQFPNSLSGSYLEILDSSVVKRCKNFCQEMGWYDKKRKIINRNGLFLIPINLHDMHTNSHPGANLRTNNSAIQCIIEYLAQYNIDAHKLIGNLKLTKYERLGHILLFNDDLTMFNRSLVDNGLDQSLLEPMYEQVAHVIDKRIGGIKAIGVKGVIQGEMRKPNIKMLYGDPITQIVENGIKYVLDVTKCMFSAGNVNERVRIPTKYMSNDRVELVVDMFCGIGYFSLPILAMNSSCKLVVTDINEEALGVCNSSSSFSGKG